MNIDEARNEYQEKVKENDSKKSMREFQIIRNVASEAQKCVNQWRHDYDIEIISVQADHTGKGVVIALWRTRK